jgi:hypothetical protein
MEVFGDQGDGREEALRRAIVDLYLDVKIRSTDEIDEYDTVQFEDE